MTRGDLSRRRVIGATATLVLLALVATMRPAPPMVNLVVVTLDTTRADRIGAYGDARAAVTPALDRLAREGVLFEDVTSPAPLTLPAHCTLFTGRLPPSHHVRENAGRLDGATPTLASVLQARGYLTGAFLGSLVLARSHGLYFGFDTYDDQIRWSSVSQRQPRRRADAVVDRALAWIAGTKDSPFFVWLHFYDAHAPSEVMAPFDLRYDGRPYEGAIASVDAQIGRLRAYLDEHHLMERTLFVVIADHGEGLGDHGEQTHGLFLYQSVLRVPFILRVPTMAFRAKRVRTPVSSADLTPTVLDLLGISPLTDVDGRTLVPTLRRARPEAPDLYAENLYVQRRFDWSEMRAIRSGRLKLIDKTRPELYDLTRDPDEAHDLSAEQPEEAARLARRLRAWHGRLDARTVGDQGAATPVPADLRVRLMSLGYVSDAAATGAAPNVAPGSDPREHVAQFNCMMLQAVELQAPATPSTRHPCVPRAAPFLTARQRTGR